MLSVTTAVGDVGVPVSAGETKGAKVPHIKVVDATFWLLSPMGVEPKSLTEFPYQRVPPNKRDAGGNLL